MNDGQILDNSLNLCLKKKEDVYEILQKENAKLKDVFLLTMDALGNYNLVWKEK